ncbi:GNAT family N-acetyltransferase [Roseobacter sp. HKCCA0434]|uniref:GNAT family N-acetyltransferase n=1 Tax=Roseobacter sp. HKCCA0434 TaxID=3079297 RepID=UPI00290598BA|nr:GNAT family N-acetyltransferase [Roseobacter sp. HKCCA0434]
MTGWTLSSDAPPVNEAMRLRAVTGWGAPDAEVLRRALDGSDLHVVARDAEGALIGMARVVGDGALYFYVQDVIVSESWRGRGVARAMVADLVARVREEPGRCLGLLAVAGLEGFYESLGFQRRPDGRFGAGMMLFT